VKWLYKRAIDIDNDQLTHLGEQGWELVSVVGPMNTTARGSDALGPKHKAFTSSENGARAVAAVLLFYFKKAG